MRLFVAPWILRAALFTLTFDSAWSGDVYAQSQLADNANSPLVKPLPSPAQPLRLQLQTELMQPDPNTEELPSFLFGLNLSGHTDRETIADGEAEFRRAGRVVRSDHMTHQTLENTLHAQDHVRVYEDGNVMTGPELYLQLDSNDGFFVNPDYTLAQNNGHGHAQRLDFIGERLLQLLQPTYTTCARGNEDWYLSADSLLLDQGSETGDAKNASLYFKNYKIMEAPNMSFPLSGNRKSGFLSPLFGVTSTSGPELTVPYYIDIAPNRDFTLYPKLLERRGEQLGGTFRFLEPNSAGDARFEVMPMDALTHQDRYSLESNGHYHNGQLDGYWNLNQVSDDNYFRDFSHTIAASSQTFLPRDAYLTYYTGSYNASARMTSYQTLQDPGAPVVPPYARLPQLTLKSLVGDINGFDLNVFSEFTRFTHPTLVDGDRLVLNPSISYPLVTPGFFVTPKISVNQTQYSLSNETPGLIGSINRTIPTFSLDSGLTFERNTEWQGKSYTQTLEPRLFYVYTPYRDQSDIPIFDTALADLNFAQIFSENTFAGQDRIADANQITAAVVSRFFAQDSGLERIRLALGQRYYLAQPQVTMPGVLPDSNSRSDLLSSLTAKLRSDLLVDTTFQYSPSTAHVTRANYGVRYQPSPGQVMSASYRYTQGQIEQVDFSGQWPLAGRLAGVGRLNYSIADRQVTEMLSGLEYNADCWLFRIVAQRFQTASNKATSAIFLQLELNGLASLGSNPLDALRRSIPGYNVPNPPASPLSHFANYE